MSSKKPAAADETAPKKKAAPKKAAPLEPDTVKLQSFEVRTGAPGDTCVKWGVPFTYLNDGHTVVAELEKGVIAQGMLDAGRCILREDEGGVDTIRTVAELTTEELHAQYLQVFGVQPSKAKREATVRGELEQALQPPPPKVGRTGPGSAADIVK